MANCVQCGRQLPGLTFGKKICQWCVQHEAAQRGEDVPIQRVEPAPWKQQQSSSMVVTQVIFGINVVVFLAMSFSGVSPLEPTTQDLLRWGANYGLATIGGQWWRLLTCVFVHIGIMHIALNMWCLWGLGRLAESIYDRWTFASVYLITGLAASVASLVWNPVGLSAGASGAIFGIAGALISSLYLGEFSLPKTVVSGTLRSVLKFAGYNLVLGAFLGRTDNAAHVGGLLMGLMLGALIARIAPQPGDTLRRIAALLCGVLIVLGGMMWLRHSHPYLLHGLNGDKLVNQGKTDDGIAELQKSIKLRPNVAATHFDLASAYIAKQDLNNAAQELQRVIALDPRYTRAYYPLAQIYVELKQPARAQDILGQLVKIDPDNISGHAGLAETLAIQNRYREAFEEYKVVAALNANYPGVYFKMGVMETRLQLYDDAIASFLKQRQIEDVAQNESLLAEVYDAKGMKIESEDARRRAAQLQVSH